MILVLDASAVINLVRGSVQSSDLSRLLDRRTILAAPEILPVEVVNVMRRLLRRGVLKEERAREALDDYRDLRIRLIGHGPYVERMWELRDRLTAYDAAYLALAEGLNATLVTLDTAFLSVSDTAARVEVLPSANHHQDSPPVP